MANIFVLVFISLICASLQTADAASFECSVEPAACKTKFGQQFEKDFMGLHVGAARKLLTTYIDKVKTIKEELSANDPNVKNLDDLIDNVSKSFQKLNDNLNNSKQVSDYYQEAMNAMTWDENGSPENDNLMKLLEKHDVQEALVDVLRKMSADVGNLWAEMYSGLRETDLKSYPEYSEVNEHIENIRGNRGHPPEPSDNFLAVKILGEKFNLSYFKNAMDTSS